jgi:uncharacterized protein YaaN involved in tellurite resistance
MTPEQIVEDFTKQRDACVENIKKAEEELLKNKELYLKLQGAIEGIALYSGNLEEEPTETTETEVVSEDVEDA